MSTDPRLALLLALADDELVMGHRLSEWTGWVPYVEEDLALSSIAQDEIAHARALYEIASTIEQRDVDALALGRTPGEYRNATLCERPNRDFAFTVARHWLYDNADEVRLRALSGSSFKELRELIAVLQLEERYHLEHANAWLLRLANGPVEARHRLAGALGPAIAEAMGLFEPVETEEGLRADGVMPRSSEEMQTEWLERARSSLTEVGLEHLMTAPAEDHLGELVPTSAGEIEQTHEAQPTPTSSGIGYGGRRGEHSEDFVPMWEEMTALYRAHPEARW